MNMFKKKSFLLLVILVVFQLNLSLSAENVIEVHVGQSDYFITSDVVNTSPKFSLPFKNNNIWFYENKPESGNAQQVINTVNIVGEKIFYNNNAQVGNDQILQFVSKEEGLYLIDQTSSQNVLFFPNPLEANNPLVSQSMVEKITPEIISIPIGQFFSYRCDMKSGMIFWMSPLYGLLKYKDLNNDTFFLTRAVLN